MSNNGFGLPSNRKLFRCRVTLPTQGGENKPFDTVLLTYSDAVAERTEHSREGRYAEVILDKVAATAYQDEKADKRKMKKGASH